jgi:ketosteroid isomerase-like protein
MIDEITNQYLDAFRRKDAAACAECYTVNAIYMACGSAPIRGRSEIQSLHESIIGSGFEILGMETTDIEMSENLAYAIQRLTSSEGDSVAMLVFRQDESGEWKVCAEAEVS